MKHGQLVFNLVSTPKLNTLRLHLHLLQLPPGKRIN
jgi:hypothetical protein